MNVNTIKEALQKGERVTLECKKAKTEVPKSIWETYSAFANTIGGLILLGVDEDKKEKDPIKRYRVIGVDDPQKIITDFWNTINSDKVNENILNNSDVEIVEMGGLQIVCIHVPQADWRVKPIYLNGNVYKGTFRRNHEGDYRCTERQVKAMIRDSFEDGNDGLLIEHYGMDDIDLDSLHRYRTLFQYRNEGHVWNELDDKSFLKNLGGYIVDRNSGREGLTMAGLLMFGKGLSIRERFDNFRMDYIDFCNLIGEERYSDRLTYDGRWENNLYQFFSRVIPKVTFDLPRPFRMEGLQRVDDTPQHKAVREAFTNSIIHSDFIMESGILRIEKHDDKLVFRNPGLLRLPIEQIYEGGVSFARNPKIQNMLRMVGYGENIGSGFPLILDAWKQAGWEKPELINKVELDEVELVMPLPNVTKDVTKDVTKELTERQRIIMEMIMENALVTIPEMSQKTGVTTRTIKRDLEAMQSKGILAREGGRKDGQWIVRIQ
jgi:predicted HTH transcriptional regulator